MLNKELAKLLKDTATQEELKRLPITVIMPNFGVVDLQIISYKNETITAKILGKNIKGTFKIIAENIIGWKIS